MRTVRPRSRHRGRTGRPWCSATRSSSSVLRVLAHRALPLQDFITLHPEHIARNNALGPMSDDGGRSITGAIVPACFSLLARSMCVQIRIRRNRAWLGSAALATRPVLSLSKQRARRSSAALQCGRRCPLLPPPALHCTDMRRRCPYMSVSVRARTAVRTSQPERGSACPPSFPRTPTPALHRHASRPPYPYSAPAAPRGPSHALACACGPLYCYTCTYAPAIHPFAAAAEPESEILVTVRSAYIGQLSSMQDELYRELLSRDRDSASAGSVQCFEPLLVSG
ncbi:hypothetical protein B0H17DRAFT_1222453 [Mycena rosella]|uniref:Uncharacterized protein n=1 Tax=Mycena rosella TaxID=1033263 RepID=A0AAD7F5V4_MYCRO|nr:hypothetical protein B0H17DRAFT_1222453 [Mycena rosella]